MSEWISVKDRLPDDKAWYLVFADYRDIEFMLFDGEEFIGVCCTPTHWQPLPEPPK